MIAALVVETLRDPAPPPAAPPGWMLPGRQPDHRPPLSAGLSASESRRAKQGWIPTDWSFEASLWFLITPSREAFLVMREKIFNNLSLQCADLLERGRVSRRPWGRG